MMRIQLGAMMAAMCLVVASGAYAQVQEAAEVVPAVVRYSGEMAGHAGERAAVRFSIYATADGGSALWSENQSVTLDKDGKYAVLLGSGSSAGLPQTVFAGGEARWLGIRVRDGEEARALLASVPYAMKAGDAATLSGVSVSELVTQEQLRGQVVAAMAAQALTAAVPITPTVAGALTGAGMAGYLPLWTAGSTLGNSGLFQSGSGGSLRMGIGTATPSTTLTVAGLTTLEGTTNLVATTSATSTAGVSSPVLELTGTAYDSATSLAVPQKFGWRTQVSGNNTAAPTGSLSLVYGVGTADPAATQLAISPKGIITFASGQTFPGVVTGVGPEMLVKAGTGLTSTTAGARPRD
jgi:hypothetical protein